MTLEILFWLLMLLWLVLGGVSAWRDKDKLGFAAGSSLLLFLLLLVLGWATFGAPIK